LINIAIDCPATSQFGHHWGQMLCTLTLAGRAWGQGSDISVLYEDPNRK